MITLKAKMSCDHWDPAAKVSQCDATVDVTMVVSHQAVITIKGESDVTLMEVEDTPQGWLHTNAGSFCPKHHPNKTERW